MVTNLEHFWYCYAKLQVVIGNASNSISFFHSFLHSRSHKFYSATPYIFFLCLSFCLCLFLFLNSLSHFLWLRLTSQSSLCQISAVKGDTIDAISMIFNSNFDTCIVEHCDHDTILSIELYEINLNTLVLYLWCQSLGVGSIFTQVILIEFKVISSLINVDYSSLITNYTLERFR